MRCIDKQEAMSWCVANGLAPPEHSKFFRPQAVTLTYRIPADSGKKTALSRAVLSLFGGEQECLLWITEFGVWPPCEDMFLFDVFRKFLGESEPLQVKPGHVFSSGDLNQVASLLGMTLYFVWGGLIASSRGGVFVEISHDEMMDVTVAGDERPLLTARRLIEPITGPAIEAGPRT